MTTEREQELERRVEDLEQESNLGWSLFLFGLPLTLLFGGLDRLDRGRQEKRRRGEAADFEAWLQGLDDVRRVELDRVLEEGLPLPEGADGDFAEGYTAHGALLRTLVHDRALRHVMRADDARATLAAGGVDVESVSVEWLRGFQAANAAMAERFGPSA